MIKLCIALLPCYSKIIQLAIYLLIFDIGKHHGNAVEMATLIPIKSKKTTPGRRNEFIRLTYYHVTYKSFT